MAKEVTKRRSPARKAPERNVVSEKLMLLVTIVGRGKADYYMDLIQSFEVNMQLSVLGEGTANAEILQYLGLASSEKTVIFSVIREGLCDTAMDTIEEKFKTIKNGKGIALAVPLSSVIGATLYGFLANNKMTLGGSNA